jgi:hypothetical protein
VSNVVIVTLSDPSARPGGHTGSCDGCGCAAEQPRVPVLACADALTRGGASTKLVTAGDEAAIDAAVKPAVAGEARLVVAAATDAELRAVVRRLVRVLAPPPSKRPAELPDGRTVFDLPPLAVLPLAPAVPPLVEALGLPRDPSAVASAVLAGTERRYDLLRTDAGSVMLHGALIGGVDAGGRLGAWRGRVEVDDAVLTNGDEPVLACSIRNAGTSDVDGLPLVASAQPDDGRVDVAVAVPILRRRLLRAASVRFEVRRARGRAVSVTPRGAEVPIVDDGVSATLARKRAWWVESGAWGVYVM